MNLRTMMNPWRPRSRRRRVPLNNPVFSKSLRPTLRFSPTAWAKLLFLRDRADVEVGGFGVAPADDLLYISDFQLVHQRSAPAYLIFESLSVADYFDRQLDAGLPLTQFARIWIHTHPADSPRPTLVDERTFDREFGRTDWAVMFILARGGQTYARLRFNVGPGGAMLIPVAVDYSRPFAGSDETAWQAEFDAKVRLWEPLRSEDAPPGTDEKGAAVPVDNEAGPASFWQDHNFLGQSQEEFFA